MSNQLDPALTHFDAHGKAQMVDVSDKSETARTASASGFISMSQTALSLVRDGGGKKGDATATAELAGIMGAKRTSDLIPLCHPLPISAVNVTTRIDNDAGGVAVVATVKTTGRTGVEMEALTAATITCLTLYDMLKSVDRTMVIERIMLDEKTGGKSGDFHRNNEYEPE